MTEATKRFVEILISHVRDRAIKSGDITWSTLDREDKSVVAKRWAKAKQEGNYDELVRMVIADSVDDAIFYLLHARDEGLLLLTFEGVNLTEDGGGELAGWYAGEWKFSLSKERTYDDFADL